MRDARFIVEHRRGPLSLADHRALMGWARECASHVLRLERRGSHAAARAYEEPLGVAIARSAAQAVATAHFADHAVGASIYALKALVSQRVLPRKSWPGRTLNFRPISPTSSRPLGPPRGGANLDTCRQSVLFTHGSGTIPASGQPRHQNGSDHLINSGVVPTIACRCSPNPVIESVTTSPGVRKTGSGLMPMPTPGGVPVAITSPGRSVMYRLT